MGRSIRSKRLKRNNEHRKHVMGSSQSQLIFYFFPFSLLILTFLFSLLAVYHQKQIEAISKRLQQQVQDQTITQQEVDGTECFLSHLL